ncbi:HIV Tat-specific factor 1 homolog isoform X3 [Quercus lobata]|uniref:HIV Tat-specific factor 1 homolog isoform X3 n=1 Tax=Quercus lobata TaxID=97700 RepID=UPI001243D3C0|nr:HIV Tat-specific factor 1 homolog isoform X3 [Quercus lobata]
MFKLQKVAIVFLRQRRRDYRKSRCRANGDVSDSLQRKLNVSSPASSIQQQQQSLDTSIEPMAPKDQIANSGLDQDKVAQDFRDIKRPTVSPQNDGCTVPIIRLIHYEDNSYALKWILFVNEEMNDPRTMLSEPGDVEADEEEQHINGCYDYVDDEDDDEECYEIDENYVEDADEDYVEDADEDMEGDNPENLEEEDNYTDFSKKYDDYADEYKPDKSDFQYLG